MPLSNKIISKLQAKALQVEKQMKTLETRRKTGALNASISFKFVNGSFIFSALYYGKFQDEGTYARKRPTRISKTLWQQYSPKENRRGRGIKPLHFTKPSETLNNKAIIGIVQPVILQEAAKEIKNNLKL